MKKFTVLALIFLLGFLTFRSCNSSDSHIEWLVNSKLKEIKIREKNINREVKEIIRRRTVAVATSDGLGSGVAVSPSGHIITAQHVVGDKCDPGLKIIFSDGSEIGASNITIVYSNEKSDFALLKTNKQLLDFAPLVSSVEMKNLEGGDKLWLCGNSYTISLLLVSEITFLASSRDSVPIDQRSLSFDNFNGPGGSGGGLFTKTGGLVGMYLGAKWETGFPSVGRALHIDSIRFFLEKHNVDYRFLADYSNL